MKALSFVALVTLAACSHSSKTPAPTPGGDGAGRIHRFQIGALEAVALQDGDITLPNDSSIVGQEHGAETTDLLKAAGLPTDAVHLSIQPLLVKAGAHVILFDTGAGAASWAKAGKLPASLALAGVAPAEVTDIFISHAHPDHVGGLVDDAGALRFPSAKIHMSEPEWAALQAAEDQKPLATAIAGTVTAFVPGAQVLPEVRAVATQGHTPGHSSYEIVSGDARLFYLGDLAHHSIVSVQQPAWKIQFDGDHEAAGAMRQQTLATLAADHERVYAVHFPFPGLGTIDGQPGALRWKAE